jgi:hypothetical protein
MQYRVIIRISLDKDTGSKFRNKKLKPLLKSAGFDNPSTGIWETSAMELADALVAMAGVMDELSQLINPGSVHLDHLWVYIDKVKKPKEKKKKKIAGPKQKKAKRKS